MGEARKDAFRVGFDGSLKLDFHGSKVTSAHAETAGGCEGDGAGPPVAAPNARIEAVSGSITVRQRADAPLSESKIVLANLWDRNRIVGTAHDGRGLEFIWEIPAQGKGLHPLARGPMARDHIMARLIFGDERAEYDELLEECYIPDRTADKPIVVGRWGVGKSAILLDHARRLYSSLGKPKEQLPFWYLEEKQFDIQALHLLRQEHENDKGLFISLLEEVWKGELLRTACNLVHQFEGIAGNRSKDHWGGVAAVAKKGPLQRSLWQHLPDIISLLFGGAKAEPASVVQRALERVFQEKTFASLQACLSDLAAKDIRPAICVEPIDTPTSALEQRGGLAQGIVTSLLNVFEGTFCPHPTQRLDVRLAIPWHRYRRGELRQPQKLDQFRTDLFWDGPGLRKFINRRIAWEFKRVGRKSSASDPWKQLFEMRVRNDHCEGVIHEDSFEYVLRHTHYRARDIQKFARVCVETYAEEKQTGLDEVLRGRGGMKISQSCIRKVVREESRRMADLLETEGARRFTSLHRLLEELHGLPVPFTIKDLNHRVAETEGIDINNALDTLWRCGVIGVFIRAQNTKQVQELRKDFGTAGFRQFQPAVGQKVQGWSLFEYSWRGRATELLARYKDPDGVEAKLILHPQLFDYLGAHPDRDIPFGA